MKAITIANTFLALAKKEGRTLNLMQLQRLTILAQCFSLSLTQKALTPEPIYAWAWGPVLPSLYQEFAQWGSQGIEHFQNPDAASEETEFIAEIWESCKHLSPQHLYALTNTKPWQEVWQSNPNSQIPQEAIVKSFRTVPTPVESQVSRIIKEFPPEPTADEILDLHRLNKSLKSNLLENFIRLLSAKL